MKDETEKALEKVIEFGAAFAEVSSPLALSNQKDVDTY